MIKKYNNIDEFISKTFNKLTRFKRSKMKEYILVDLPDDPDDYYRRTKSWKNIKTSKIIKFRLPNKNILNKKKN